MSPMPPSRPTCWSGPTRRPWWSTCGRRGAGRAGRSARSSSKVVAEADGVELVKVDVDANPRSAATFQVQSIPAVYAIRDRKVVDSFVGALPEPAVRQWVAGLTPAPTEVDRLVAAGDEASLRQALELEPANERAVLGLAALLVGDGATPAAREEALALLARLPETAETRHLAAQARLGRRADAGGRVDDGIEAKLDGLLERVRDDEDGPPGVPRPARGPRPRRSPHRDLPQGPHGPAVLRAASTVSSGRAVGVGPMVASQRCAYGQLPCGCELGPALRPDHPGAGHGDPQPDARTRSTTGARTGTSTPSTPGPSGWSPRAPTCSTSAGSRPGRVPRSSEAEELDRVVPGHRRRCTPASTSRCRSTPGGRRWPREAYRAGAVVGNDISGFADPDYLPAAAAAGATVVATHIRLGPPGRRPRSALRRRGRRGGRLPGRAGRAGPGGRDPRRVGSSSTPGSIWARRPRSR